MEAFFKPWIKDIFRYREVLALRGLKRGSTQFVHGRSRMTIDPRIPNNGGTEHVGFSPTT